jgi:hypothetical protein
MNTGSLFACAPVGVGVCRGLRDDRRALALNNYPPLSFIVVRLVAPLFPNAITGVEPYRSFRLFGLERRPIAARDSLATRKRPPPWRAIVRRKDDERFLPIRRHEWFKLFGLAVAAWASSVFLSAPDARAICVAFFLTAVADFIKHTLVAIPLSALVCPAITDRHPPL